MGALLYRGRVEEGGMFIWVYINVCASDRYVGLGRQCYSISMSVCVCEHRGGVLEPEGTVAIKFRRPDLEKTMQRLDNTCKQLKEKLAETSLKPADKVQLQKQLKERQDHIMPMFHQVLWLHAVPPPRSIPQRAILYSNSVSAF